MGVTNDQIIESIKESKNLELNSLKTGIRRKNNQELPIFEGSRKKIKIEEKQKYEEKKENNNKQQEEELKKEP